MPSTPLETTTPYMYLLPLTGSWSYFWSVDLFDLLVIWVGRDEYCPDTLASLYKQASHPDKIFIGLVQQNCYEHCRSGVLEGLKVVDVGPDPDCKQLFCDTEVTNQLSPPFLSHHFPQLGKPICARDQIRLFNINESESLGPYMGRFQESSSSFWCFSIWKVFWGEAVSRRVILPPDRLPLLLCSSLGSSFGLGWLWFLGQ